MKILLIEDQEELRELTTYNLQKNNRYQVVATESANDGLIILEDLNIDLILLDLMLPGLKGLDFLKIIRGNDRFAHIPVIIISAKTEENDIITGLQLGADDYMTKPFSIKILLAKIETILRRTSKTEREVLSYRELLIDTGQHKVSADGSDIILTIKEFELLSLMVKNPKKAFHRNQLLNTVWGYDADVYTRTVDAHISSLRKKLGESGKLIKSVPKVGYGLDI